MIITSNKNIFSLKKDAESARVKQTDGYSHAPIDPVFWWFYEIRKLYVGSVCLSRSLAGTLDTGLEQHWHWRYVACVHRIRPTPSLRDCCSCKEKPNRCCLGQQLNYQRERLYDDDETANALSCCRVHAGQDQQH